MTKLSIGFIALLLTLGISLQAQRTVVSLNQNWQFRYGWEVDQSKTITVNLPHTWNTKDALGGNLDYYRGIGIYSKKLDIRPEWKNKKVFIRFLGSNLVTDVFVNYKHVGEHRGGYTAFAFDITKFLLFDTTNFIMVKVNNAPQLDVMPLLGDFNFYGGLYRDVDLYVTNPNCISLLDYGSKGVYLTQSNVTNDKASVSTVVKILGNDADNVSIKVLDATGKEVLSKNNAITNENRRTGELRVPFELNKPHLWNGVDDPYMYRVKVELQKDGVAVDAVTEPLGLRYYSVDPDKGVFLNGKHIQLRGVCRHQDRPELGNAIALFQQEEDINIMREMGANAFRMAHYPNHPYVYHLTDTKGIIVWSEIPFVGPGGYADQGFVNAESFKNNGKTQLIEMIRQNINHPSVLFWGLFNELKDVGDSPKEYLEELNKLAHIEDPSRITTSASNINGEINNISDVVAWNKYFGWYGGELADIGKWADRQHKETPNRAIGISEYGAGASIIQQSEELTKTVPTSYWHPENWQTKYHEVYWEEIDKRPFLWGTFIWNLFDFGAAHRTEGEKDGKNDKGIVSFDRKDRKDAFYFYKANWNTTDPMIYIAERRLTHRTSTNQIIKVYSNQKDLSLWVNGKKYQPSTVGTYSRYYFTITLQPGKNELVAKSLSGLEDHIYLQLD